MGDGTCANQTTPQLNEIQNGVGKLGSELALWQNSFFGFEMFHKIKSFIHEAVEAVSLRSSYCICRTYFVVRFLDRSVVMLGRGFPIPQASEIFKFVLIKIETYY